MGYLIRSALVELEIHDDGAAVVNMPGMSGDLSPEQFLALASALNAPHIVAHLAAVVERRDNAAYTVEQARWAQSEAADAARRAATWTPDSAEALAREISDNSAQQRREV